MEKSALQDEIKILKQFIQLLNGEEALKRVEEKINILLKDKKIIRHEVSGDYIKTLLENR